MVQNEAPYLLEWIEYHRLIGIQHFFIYNDRGNDESGAILKPYIEAGVVSWINWNGNITVDQSVNVPADPSYTRNQRYALADCIYNRGKLTKWIGIWDIDEFLHFRTDGFKSISSLINDYAVPQGWTSIHLPSTSFGPSNFEKRPSGLVIDNYRWRSSVVAFGYIQNKTNGFSGKTFYRTDCAMPEVHHSPFPPKHCVNGIWPELVEENGQNFWPKYPVSLKHYRSKSYEDFIRKTEKWKIGVHTLGSVTWDSFQKEHANEYQEYDLDMLEFVKKVTKAIQCNSKPF